MPTFYDQFSGHARAYATHRPRYPRALFASLAERSPGRDVALDVATGNGQAAIALADFFRRVIAVDASEAQLAEAEPHERVEYQLASAERLPVEDGSCDLITVAQALHWLDLDPFYDEARRALRSGGLIAAWCYRLPRVSSGVDAQVERLYTDLLGPYWSERRRHVDAGYADLPFPFHEIEPPALEIRERWTSDRFCDYLRTWSAAKTCEAQSRRDAVAVIEPDLRRAWGGEPRDVRWPLSLRIGRGQ